MRCSVLVERVAVVLCAAFLTLSFAACSPSNSGSDVDPDAIEVIASIPPLAMIAAEICGRPACAQSILPPGGNPHHFEPRPSDLRRVGRADLLLLVGLGFDDWAASSLRVVRGDAWQELRVGEGEGLDLLPLAENPGDGATDGEVWDPHIWLDPEIGSAIGVRVAEALARHDPENAAAYMEHAKRFKSEMKTLDADLVAEFVPLKGEGFVATHAGWAYFARRVGLRQVAVLETVPGREPGPQTLLQVAAQARSAKARAVFSGLQLAQGSARVISEETGLPIVVLDPFGGPGREGRESYAGLLRWNADRIAQALR